MVRVRVSVMGSVSYLNKKFVVVLAFVASSVDHNGTVFLLIFCK